MNKVLIICDSFPPYGGLRAGSLAKYLPIYKWTPVVLAWRLKNDFSTEDNFKGISSIDENSIHWVSEANHSKAYLNKRLINRLTLLLKPELSRPEGLLRNFISVAENQIDFKNIKAIIATTSGWLPVFSAASHLSKKFNILWIADLRDIDEQWPDRDKDHLRLNIYKRRGIIRRQQLLKSASAIVTISRWHKHYLEQKCRRPVELIYNGFDPSHFSTELPPVNRNNFFITYTGAMLNKNTRNPEMFFEACRILIKNNKEISKNLKIRFYSPAVNKDTLLSLAREYSLEDYMLILEQIHQTKVPFVLSESAILLMVTSRKTKGQMTTKFYEYLATRRPILCVPEDDGSIKNVLLETQAGICANSVADAIGFIEDYYQKWKCKNDDYFRHKGDLSPFSRKSQTGDFATLLNKITKH